MSTRPPTISESSISIRCLGPALASPSRSAGAELPEDVQGDHQAHEDKGEHEYGGRPDLQPWGIVGIELQDTATSCLTAASGLYGLAAPRGAACQLSTGTADGGRGGAGGGRRLRVRSGPGSHLSVPDGR